MEGEESIPIFLVSRDPIGSNKREGVVLGREEFGGRSIGLGREDYGGRSIREGGLWGKEEFEGREEYGEGRSIREGGTCYLLHNCLQGGPLFRLQPAIVIF